MMRTPILDGNPATDHREHFKANDLVVGCPAPRNPWEMSHRVHLSSPDDRSLFAISQTPGVKVTVKTSTETLSVERGNAESKPVGPTLSSGVGDTHIGNDSNLYNRPEIGAFDRST
jgi:hypothetical protein